MQLFVVCVKPSCKKVTHLSPQKVDLDLILRSGNPARGAGCAPPGVATSPGKQPFVGNAASFAPKIKQESAKRGTRDLDIAAVGGRTAEPGNRARARVCEYRERVCVWGDSKLIRQLAGTVARPRDSAGGSNFR